MRLSARLRLAAEGPPEADHCIINKQLLIRAAEELEYQEKYRLEDLIISICGGFASGAILTFIVLLTKLLY